MDIIAFGNKDFVCVVSGWTPDDNKPGFGITDEDKDHLFKDDDF